MQYQSFDNTSGSSKSFEKLVCLRIPDLKGKSFLDVGCNEGFFCGYALHAGAEKIIGIDLSAKAIEKAKIRFPEVQFLNQSWDFLPEGQFDVITHLSALHYAEDQAALIHKLVNALSPDGVLILEIGIAPGSKSSFVQIQRTIDERFFPTRNKLHEILDPYAWKVLGHSVNQAGDPVQRYVVHIRKPRPYAYLMMASAGSGKSTISRKLFKQTDVVTLSGDLIYSQISKGKHKVPAALQDLISKNYKSSSINQLVQEICETGQLPDVVNLWVSLAKKQDLVLDSYVPDEYKSQVTQMMFAQGFFPVQLCWDIDQSLSPGSPGNFNAEQYKEFLTGRSVQDKHSVLSVKRHSGPLTKLLLGYHLDSPQMGEIIASNGKIRISGWALPVSESETQLRVYVQCGDKRTLHKFNKNRPDVLTAMFDDNIPDYWNATPCGFSFDALVGDQQCEVGITVNNVDIVIATLQPLPNNELAEKNKKRKSKSKNRFLKFFKL
jgi:SAM-dependent methyltransferase